MAAQQSRTGMFENVKAHRPVITGRRGMASTGHSLASCEALYVLKKGGNAMDAALAAAAVLSVIKSYHCGLGGDVFALYYSAADKKLYCLNGSGRSPGLLRREFYQNAIPARGALAANVPGAVDAWVQLANRFATSPLKELWEPAIDYAANGFPVFPHLARVIKSFGERGYKDPAWRKIFFPHGKPLQVNELLVQNDLARTLSEISCNGRDAFYDGRVAESICRTFEEKGGCFSLRDFREHQSVWETPVCGSYRGYDVYVPPPNSYGLLLLLQLALLERQDPATLSQNSGATVELQLKAQIRALESGCLWIADSECFDRKALDTFLLDYPTAKVIQSYSAQISARSGEDTTYITTADDRGNWVSMIQSVHESFGCGIIADGTGIILNNRTQGFNLEPGHPNEIGPHKRPAHTLSPAMVFKDHAPWLALGTPGGMGQTQFLAQILSNLIDFGMDIQQAIEAPRWQSKGASTVEIETRFPSETKLHLQNAGFKVKLTESWDFRMGGAEAILMDRNTGVFQAGADPRRDGYAIGY
jgi:gamma-glutamyltranspeptidase/glutathione hydrolase